MAKYRVELLDRKTQRELDHIPDPDFSRVAHAILGLEDNPRPPGCRKLHGLQGWRIRIGNWRVIYHINDVDHVVTLVAIADAKTRTADHAATCLSTTLFSPAPWHPALAPERARVPP